MVRMLSSACFAKKVLVKAVRSWIGLFVASAHHDVNSNELRVLRLLLPPDLVDVLAAGRVGVVLGQRAVADDEELDVLEQPGAGPEAVPLVAVDLVERLADVDTTALELDVDHRQTVDQNGHVVAIGVLGAALARSDLVLVDHLQAVIVDVLLVEEADVLGRAIVSLQNLDVVLLDADGLLNDAFVGSSDLLGEEPIPLRVART